MIFFSGVVVSCISTILLADCKLHCMSLCGEESEYTR